jgi:hypothetical protein
MADEELEANDDDDGTYAPPLAGAAVANALAQADADAMIAAAEATAANAVRLMKEADESHIKTSLFTRLHFVVPLLLLAKRPIKILSL